MKSLRYRGSTVVYLLASRTEWNTTIQKPLRKQRGNISFVMNKEKIKEKVYLTRKVKEKIILNKEGKDLSPT